MLPKIITSFSPRKPLSSYYPAGSFSSHQHSEETEENFSERYSNSNISIEDEFSNKSSFKIISYETLSPLSQGKDREAQTSFAQDSSKPLEKIKEMGQIIDSLQDRCNSYEKQNHDLIKEIQQASKELQENNRNSLRTEVQRLKNKVNMHENMLIKLLEIAEDLCEEEPDISKKSSVLDIHTYNYLISKLEIARYRMSRYATRISQLEYEKASISEMLNCYITTDKIIDTKSKSSSSERTTPDNVNPSKLSSTKCSPRQSRNFVVEKAFRKKCTVLMETNGNNYGNRGFDEDNYYKRPSSTTSDIGESQEALSRSTMGNLKGISTMARQVGVVGKQKNGHSFSVSPLVPKPKKNSSKTSIGKENCKSITGKTVRAQADDIKKKTASKNYC